MTISIYRPSSTIRSSHVIWSVSMGHSAVYSFIGLLHWFFHTNWSECQTRVWKWGQTGFVFLFCELHHHLMEWCLVMMPQGATHLAKALVPFTECQTMLLDRSLCYCMYSAVLVCWRHWCVGEKWWYQCWCATFAAFVSGSRQPHDDGGTHAGGAVVRTAGCQSLHDVVLNCEAAVSFCNTKRLCHIRISKRWAHEASVDPSCLWAPQCDDVNKKRQTNTSGRLIW